MAGVWAHTKIFPKSRIRMRCLYFWLVSFSLILGIATKGFLFFTLQQIVVVSLPTFASQFMYGFLFSSSSSWWVHVHFMNLETSIVVPVSLWSPVQDPMILLLLGLLKFLYWVLPQWNGSCSLIVNTCGKILFLFLFLFLFYKLFCI